VKALYQPFGAAKATPCEILEVRLEGIVCRETDKFWPGVFLAKRGTLRPMPVAKARLTEVKDPVAQRLQAKLRQAGVA
jgi:hypothetical protein